MKKSKKSKNKSEISESEDSSSLPGSNQFIVSEVIPMRKLQDMYIEWAIKMLDGDKEAAACYLEITSKTIYNRIRNGEIQKHVQNSE